MTDTPANLLALAPDLPLGMGRDHDRYQAVGRGLEAAALEEVVRNDWGRLAAVLTGQFRRLDLVEDALGDAVEAAARRWPSEGMPDRPAAWLLTVARRRILDHLRSEAMAARRRPLLVTDAERTAEGRRVMVDPGGLVEDDRLRLVLLCTHPALGAEGGAALALRLVLGVSTHDIARLFLVSEPTMAARITRAKKKIVAAGIPFGIPSATALPERLDALATTAYLAFTAGYAPASGDALLRAELSGEAIRLARVGLSLRPNEPVLVALLALMLLQHSRRDARVDAGGDLVLLPDQDRNLWHRGEIDEASALLAGPALAGPLTQQAAVYAVQARIAAEHALAPSPAATRWDRIVALYDVLLDLGAGPSAQLARAIAIAEADGPAAGLDALAGLAMSGHRPLAARAEFLTRLGDHEGARAAYNEAIVLCHNDIERRHLSARAGAL